MRAMAAISRRACCTILKELHCGVWKENVCITDPELTLANQFTSLLKRSTTRNQHHLLYNAEVKLPPVEDIVNEQKINEMLERTKERAKDRKAVADILQKARDRALLKDSVLLPQVINLPF